VGQDIKEKRKNMRGGGVQGKRGEKDEEWKREQENEEKGGEDKEKNNK
jgi:hypothetical protein